MAAKKKQLDFTKEPPETLTDQPFYGLVLDDEQLAFANAIWNPENDIIFCNSVAGTGKTTIATGVANLLVKYGMYDSIIYIMSPYGERKQGYLAGTITQKSSVYFEAFYQALETCGVNPNTDINDESMVNQKNGTGYITCITDTFLRGSNLNNAVVLIDEAENFTIPQLQKTLTRIGKKAKVIVIGHTLQCDLEDKKTSGFDSFIRLFRNMDRCAICELHTNHRSWISAHADTIDDFLKAEQRKKVQKAIRGLGATKRAFEYKSIDREDEGDLQIVTSGYCEAIDPDYEEPKSVTVCGCGEVYNDDRV